MTSAVPAARGAAARRAMATRPRPMPTSVHSQIATCGLSSVGSKYELIKIMTTATRHTSARPVSSLRPSARNFDRAFKIAAHHRPQSAIQIAMPTAPIRA